MTELYKSLEKLVRGELKINAPMAEYCTLGVGGKADLLFIPKDINDLATALRRVPTEIPITIIGGGSNILVRDGGLSGLTILTTKMQNNIKIKDTYISADAGVSSVLISNIAANHGISGFEFMCGLPGTIGGAVCGNAECFGGETSKVIESVDVIDRKGNLIHMKNNELGFRYRGSNFPPNCVMITVNMHGVAASPDAIRKKMAENKAARAARQTIPVGMRTCGCLFKNPEGDTAGRLIDAAGWRGRMVNGSGMSPGHANYLVTFGTASATDLESLAHKIQKEVFEKFGIKLELELKILGNLP